MNLTNNPTRSQLREVLRSVDDEAGHHILWVDAAGDVHLDMLDENESPAEWSLRLGQRVRLRYETLCCGCGYTGPDAAHDDHWINELYNCLITDWQAGRQGYMDYPGVSVQ